MDKETLRNPYPSKSAACSESVEPKCLAKSMFSQTARKHNQKNILSHHQQQRNAYVIFEFSGLWKINCISTQLGDQICATNDNLLCAIL